MTPRRALSTVATQALLGAAVGVLCGASSALFLALLDRATAWRLAHPHVVFALPLAGLVLGALYDRFGRPIRGGANVVIDRLHDGGETVALRMAPMVLAGTVLTHLFGGSAGREGTAVQMGASLADQLAHRFKLHGPTRRHLLAAGVGGGFGAVFGTPVAGALFALEFSTLGRIEHRSLIPALAAALVGDLTTRALGIAHTHYPAVAPLALTPSLLARWALFGVAMALAAAAFIELLHAVKRVGERRLPSLPWRMAAGGAAVLAMRAAMGSDDALGLGVPVIVRAFTDPSLPWWMFLAKLVFTAVTLGAGFLGGEVTPLFFVGATLGNALARALHLPLSMGAGVGMAAVFAAASNTPIALSIMAVELLGASVLPHVVVVNAVAWTLSGHRSIYPSQRVSHRKDGASLASLVPLRDLPDDREG